MILVWWTKCIVSAFYMGFSYGKMTWAGVCSSTFFCLNPASLPIDFVALAVCALKYCVDMCDCIENISRKLS